MGEVCFQPLSSNRLKGFTEQISTNMSVVIQIHFDGGCRPNPGRGYGSYQITSDRLNHRVERMDFGDNHTSNTAEYRALIAALKWLKHHTDKSEQLRIFTDSNLVSQQLRGVARVKVEHLKEAWSEAVQLLLPYKAWTVQWHGRENNVRRFGH